MHKTLEEVIKILKELALNIYENKASKEEAHARVASLAVALENFLNTADQTNDAMMRDMKEKIDFLIFMQSKNVTQGNKLVVIAGEALFRQWQEAKIKARDHKIKQVPNEGNGLAT